MTMNRCPYCGGSNRRNIGEQCPHCGAPVEAQPVKAPERFPAADLDLLIQALDEVLGQPRRLEYPA